MFPQVINYTLNQYTFPLRRDSRQNHDVSLALVASKKFMLYSHSMGRVKLDNATYSRTVIVNVVEDKVKPGVPVEPLPVPTFAPPEMLEPEAPPHKRISRK